MQLSDLHHEWILAISGVDPRHFEKKGVEAAGLVGAVGAGVAAAALSGSMVVGVAAAGAVSAGADPASFGGVGGGFGGIASAMRGPGGAGDGAAGAVQGAAAVAGGTASAAGGAAAAGASAAGGGLPRPMAADCKVVHGQCPGPDNHVLCKTHHHVLDTETHMIIADSVADYVKHHMPKGAAHPKGHDGGGGHASAGHPAAANATADASKATHAQSTTHAAPAALATPAAGAPGSSQVSVNQPMRAPLAPAPADATTGSPAGGSARSAAPAPAAAPPIDEAAITKGIGVVFVSAKDDLTARHGLINDEIELWVNQSATMIEDMDGNASSVASMILKVVDLMLTIVVPEAKAFQVVISEIGAVMKAAQMVHDINAGSDADTAKSAIQQVRASASKAIEANGRAKDRMLPIVQTTLTLLRDADSLERLARGAPDDIEVMAQRAGVPNKAAINGARTKLRAGMRHELRSWLKQAAMDKAKQNMKGVAELFGGHDDEETAARKKQQLLDYEVQWGKDYDDHQESKMLDSDEEIAVGRR